MKELKPCLFCGYEHAGIKKASFLVLIPSVITIETDIENSILTKKGIYNYGYTHAFHIHPLQCC